MLLVIDIGNTHSVLGVYRDEELLRHWRVTTDRNRTVDEYAIVIHDLFRLADLRFDEVRDVIISCVVPPVLNLFEELCRRYFKRTPYIVGPGIKTGMPILYDNPREVGADRIVNAVAAYEKYRRALVIVDFGTATTFDAISRKGEYLGGAIAPGLGISAEALFERASKLPRVELAHPAQAIAKNTVQSMQAGIYFGYIGVVEALVERMKLEMKDEPMVIATGGFAPLLAEGTKCIDRVDGALTLEGLRIIYRRNAQAL